MPGRHRVVRLGGDEQPDWENRAHFFAVCAVAMRSILADHARQKRCAKRGGGWQRVGITGISGLNSIPLAQGGASVELLLATEGQAELARRIWAELGLDDRCGALAKA